MLLALLALFAAVESPAPHHTLLRAAHLFDARKGTLVSPGAVLVEDARIAKVGSSLTAPEGSETIDLGEATLLPGLMDAHEHLTFEARPRWFKAEVSLLQ